jgi:hypothetical protein
LSCASGEIRGNKSLENVFISGMERGEEKAVDRFRRPNLSFLFNWKIRLGLGNSDVPGAVGLPGKGGKMSDL